ncbi:Gfo/Idh/MocA family oxidoreductase [Candidatus Sumerlaeota bacterium]|nr:Gfo/Idh/MocA family oxidoreductase [Candidatus Sumerlaeota bacterium]
MLFRVPDVAQPTKPDPVMDPPEIPIPPDPLKIALIGAGSRSTSTYRPVLQHMKPWVEVVAVCDPVRDHCDAAASETGARPYYDIHELVRDRPMEAAIVVTPAPSHHSISVLLSSHGIHNHVETPWCALPAQARDMVETARAHRAIVRVAENFFRFSIDRFSNAVRDSRVIGRIGRIVCYGDHTGYHNNSRWIHFAQAHPLWVQALEHPMRTIGFRSEAARFHETENYRVRFFEFPDGLFVADHAANIKGFLGRHARPGYTEWHGERGTLVHRADMSTTVGDPVTFYEDGKVEERLDSDGRRSRQRTELRVCSDRQAHRPEDPYRKGGGRADEISVVVREYDKRGVWTRTHCQTSRGPLECVNPYRPGVVLGNTHQEYGCMIMDHIVDFVLAVRGIRESEFDESDAMMSLLMEFAARESSLREGKRIAFPIEGEMESESIWRETLKKQFGADPMDVDAMLDIKYPKP